MPFCVRKNVTGHRPNLLGGDQPPRNMAQRSGDSDVRIPSGRCRRIQVVNQSIGLGGIFQVPSSKSPWTKGFTVLGKLIWEFISEPFTGISVI